MLFKIDLDYFTEFEEFKFNDNDKLNIIENDDIYHFLVRLTVITKNTYCKLLI